MCHNICATISGTSKQINFFFLKKKGWESAKIRFSLVLKKYAETIRMTCKILHQIQILESESVARDFPGGTMALTLHSLMQGVRV